MVTVRVGNLCDSSAQTLVNTVNCVGIMGKGVALEFKERFPDMFEDYQRRRERGEVRLGRPYLYRRLVTTWILNFPTKEHWRSVSKVSDIVEGRLWLKQHYKPWGITSLAVPPLERVADLFARMRTQDAEIAATVHFAAEQYERRHKKQPMESDVLDEVKQWKQRGRPTLDEFDVARSIRNLNMLGWIRAAPSRQLTPADEAVMET